MSKTFYARLQLMLDGKSTIPPDPKGIYAPAFVKRYTYKLKITPKAGEKIKNGEKLFTGGFTKLRSADHAFITDGQSLDTLAEVNAKFTVTWEIYFDGKLNYSILGKLFAKTYMASKENFSFDIRFTKSNTQWKTGDKSHLVTQAVSSGVGWYLIKREEAFGDLMLRAFKNPTRINWDVMKELNAHLGSLSTVTILKPGQVVIVSQTKSGGNDKLPQMKAAAVKAQAAWKAASADGKIDTTEMALIDLLIKGHKFIPIDAEDLGDIDDNPFVAKGINISDDYKPYVDGTLGFAAANFGQVDKSRLALANAAHQVPYTTQKGTVKRANKLAAQTNPKAFRMINDSKFARKLIQWDTGIQANRARDYIRAEVQLRSANTNGGIDTAAESLKKIGKYSKYLKRAGYVGIAIDAGTATYKAYDAYEKGDVKGGNIEVGKGIGTIAGGVGAGMVVVMVFGVATGGVGLVAIGIFAAVAGYGGGKAGEILGRKVAETINSDMH